MATDSPYGLDFLFSEITNVHFGTGVWVGLLGFINSDAGGPAASANVNASFPGIAGGTPGFALTTGNTPIAGPSHKVVSPKDLANTIITGAGQGIHGFTMGAASGLGPGNGPLGMAFMECAGPFSTPFKVQYFMQALSLPTNIMTAELFLFKDTVKVGVVIDVAANPTQLPLTSAVGGASPTFPPFGSVTLTFTVDPKKLTIVQN